MSKNRLMDLFIQLAKIEGLSKNERDVADFITNYLENLGLEVLEDDAANITKGNSGNLIAKYNGGGKIVLMSHMDTARSTEKLVPVIKKDRICSDGKTILGADNRAGIAAILNTVARIIESEGDAAFTIAFTVCEETTLAGSKHIQIPEGIEGVFIFDSSKRPGQFIYKSYGAKSFEIEITGKSAHAGIAPEEGISSIEVASRAISELNLGRIDEITTANIGTITGGTATNVIAEKTFLNGEIRSLQMENIDRIEKEIFAGFDRIVKKFTAKFTYNSQWEFQPYELSSKDYIYKLITTTITKSGLHAEPVITAGGSDVNSLYARGIQGVNIGIGAQNPHSNNEFILIKDLIKTTEIAEKLILESQT